ncbi:MAG: Gfo/Idh/MocA family oxidoreductase [Pontibacterium sp.]
MTIRVALIGTGIMGMDHARLFAQDLPNVELHTICDVDEARAKAVAKELGVKHVSSSPEEAATSDEIDAVVIASPDHTHAPLSIAAIRAGKYVLCEKPLSTSSEECIEVMQLEEKLGKQMVQVGFMRRFDPSYTEMKAALTNGTLGEAIMLHCYHRNVQAPANFTGQMAISNSAPHEFDAARFLLDEEVSEISVFQPKSVDTSKTGAPVFMVLETSSGRLVNVEINNNAAYGYDVRAELVGAKGSVFLRSPVNSELHTALSASTAYAPDWRPRFAEAYRLQNKAWINSILTGVPSDIGSNAWDSYCASCIAEAGVKALATGSRVAVELIQKPSLYR